MLLRISRKPLLMLQVVASLIEAVAWCSMIIMIGLETRIYIREFRWYVRFGVIYVLVGEAVLLNLILDMRSFYPRLVFSSYFNDHFLFSVILYPRKCGILIQAAWSCFFQLHFCFFFLFRLKPENLLCSGLLCTTEVWIMQQYEKKKLYSLPSAYKLTYTRFQWKILLQLH